MQPVATPRESLLWTPRPTYGGGGGEWISSRQPAPLHALPNASPRSGRTGQRPSRRSQAGHLDPRPVQPQRFGSRSTTPRSVARYGRRTRDDRADAHRTPQVSDDANSYLTRILLPGKLFLCGGEQLSPRPGGDRRAGPARAGQPVGVLLCASRWSTAVTVRVGTCFTASVPQLQTRRGGREPRPRSTGLTGHGTSQVRAVRRSG